MNRGKIRRTIWASLTILFAMFIVRNVAFAQGGPPNPDAPIFRGDALMLTAERYTDDFDVSFNEAMTRLLYGDEIRKLQKYFFEKYPDEFAGLWVQHEPEYRIYVRFTDVTRVHEDGRLAGSPVKEFLTIMKASVPLYQLISTQRQMYSILLNYDIQFESGINIAANRVEIYSASAEAIDNVLQKRNISVPPYVQIVQVDHLSQPATDIYAGLVFSPCTSGFSVLHNEQSEGILGISTAGHCGCAGDYCSCQSPPCSNTNSVYYNGTLLPLQGVEYHDSYDVEWHTAPGFTVRNLFFDGTYNVYVYGIRSRSDQYVGEYVCKYGKTTGAGCGTISDLYYSYRGGTYIRVHSGTVDIGEPGDSGGPWYLGNIAYGIMTAHFPDNNDALYMPVDNYHILDLCILRDESNPTVPVLEGTLENNALTLTWIHEDDVCGYEIHRSTAPYFTPSEGSLVIQITANVSSFSSGLGVGDVNHNYFYKIKAVTGSESTPSNAVGEFDFPLTPGS